MAGGRREGEPGLLSESLLDDKHKVINLRPGQWRGEGGASVWRGDSLSFREASQGDRLVKPKESEETKPHKHLNQSFQSVEGRTRVSLRLWSALKITATVTCRLLCFETVESARITFSKQHKLVSLWQMWTSDIKGNTVFTSNTLRFMLTHIFTSVHQIQYCTLRWPHQEEVMSFIVHPCKSSHLNFVMKNIHFSSMRSLIIERTSSQTLIKYKTDDNVWQQMFSLKEVKCTFVCTATNHCSSRLKVIYTVK